MKLADRESVFLPPGELYASNEPRAVTTLLGSCVAVCLWDAELKAGGLTHFLLPEATPDGHPSPRFGDIAVSMLIEKLFMLGAREHTLCAKIFGGSSLLWSDHADEDQIGARNVRMARETLALMKIPVIAEDVGGRHGRKLSFDLATGEAWVKRI